jgi:hypothetical protein
MDFRGLWVLTLCASGVLVSSCARTTAVATRPPAAPSSTPGVQWVSEDFHGDGLVVTLDHPVAWQSQLQPLSLHYTAIFGFLANFPLQQFCTHPSSSSFECTWANAGKVPMDGVLVTFGTGGYGPVEVDKRQLFSQGTPTMIDGRRASEQSGNGSGCLGSGADHSLRFWIDDGKPAGVFDITFCWLGSNATLAEDVHTVGTRLSLRPDPNHSGPYPS